MRFESVILSALVASAATAMGTCGTPEPTTEEVQRARNLQAHEIEARSMGVSLANKTGLNINVYYHVVAKSESKSDGFLLASDLERQTEVLNERYRPHNISWTKAGADWHLAPAWTENEEQFLMQRILHKGGYADMNVYLLPAIEYVKGQYVGEGILGYCAEFPKEVIEESDNWYHDGVLVRSDTLPGGAQDHYDLGMTLVHEAGHWLGLYHTFQGGCFGEGDGIDDTPAEWGLFHTYDCDKTRDTCPGEGPDAVTNYMNYALDSCLEEFTPGQEVRMYSQWDEFRASHQEL